jgi:prophage tail gpP-like protein
MYTATTIFGALEGLALGYAARPAWQPSTTETDLAADSQLPPIRIEPSTVAWDSLARVSAINSGYTYVGKPLGRMVVEHSDYYT